MTGCSSAHEAGLGRPDGGGGIATCGEAATLTEHGVQSSGGDVMNDFFVYGHSAARPPSDQYLLPRLVQLLAAQNPSRRPMFEIGAGNGSTAIYLQNLGYSICGVEPSTDGVRIAREIGANIQPGSAYDNLAGLYGQFRVVYSLEVIEHLYSPRSFVETAFELVEPGGHLIVSTPFHGYWKNLALAIAGRMDSHFTPLWEHGHIKFWSCKTLRLLLTDGGFSDVRFSYAGRLYPFSKSVFAIASRSH